VPSPQMQQIIDSLWQRRAARATAPARSFAERRMNYAPVGQLLPLPGDVVVEQADPGGIPAWWLTAPGADPARVMLYLHGGGYQLGSLRSHGPLAAELGRVTGRRVFLPEYRLAPEHPFPAAVEDTLTAWRWMVSGGGADPASTLVAGDSAGGGLALALLQHLRDTGEELPVGAVLISPFLDLTASGASLTERAGQDPVFTSDSVRGFADVYLNGADPREPAASPLLGSAKGLPPLLIQTGGAEVLLSDSERLAQAAADAGVAVTLQIADGLPHVYHGALGTPETTAALDQIAEFARQLTLG
jgi:monoterpene epsilon-lactone hydrolase